MPNRYRFGHCELRPAERALHIHGEAALLGARAYEVLLALIERRERVVTKDELLAAAWPGMVVEENNLQVQISSLRKLLGADTISTIPGRGYRFTALLDGADPQPAKAPTMSDGAPRAPTNLPVEQPPLYGRDAEVDAVRELLEAHRLVTITGAGGIGKTRVAHAVAHALRERHADGTWLVELAPLADSRLLPAGIAQALGLPLRGQRPSADELVAALEPQRLLLVLDNCEHLVEAASPLAQALLARAPGVRLLVTSQEPLRLPGEQLFRLGTLDVPAADADAARALEHGAVRLFVERVQALDARFALGTHNAAAVVDICRGLDGLALAIELAAARVPALGVQGVRERLGARLRMLTAGSRIALRRHQTLRAALDWSHGLLDEPDRAVFRRLGVFCGGCTIEAAQAVAADEQLDEWAVLDSLTWLVDKSLVVAEGDDRPRYRMLESARAYALEKLAEAKETHALAHRHAAHVDAQFGRASAALFAGAIDEDAFIALRGQELDNLRAALAWSLGDDGDADVALALLAHTAPLCFLLPSSRECERWWRALVRRIGGRPQEPERAARYGYAQILWSLQHQRLSDHGADPLDVGPSALRALGDPPRQAYGLCALAIHAIWRGELNLARAALEANGTGTANWPAWLQGLHLHASIKARLMAGELPDAQPALAKLLAQLRADGAGESRAAFSVRTDAATLNLGAGRIDDAARELQALAELGRRQRRDVWRMCFVLAPLALALTELGRLDEARAVVLEVLPLLQQTGMRSDYAPFLALLAARRGRPDAAARLLGAGDAWLERAGGCRPLIERRAREQVLALLTAVQAPAQIDAWRAAGVALGDDAFARLAAG